MSRAPEPPSLDDLVPRSRSDRPRGGPLSTRPPPPAHRSAPPPGRPRFIDRSGPPEPRAPGQGLPGPDSFGRLPAPQRFDPAPGIPSPSQQPPHFPVPEETVAMRGGFAAPHPPVIEYYPPPQPPQQRDPNEYYPHLSAPPPAARTPSHAPPPMQHARGPAAQASGGYDAYPGPPPQYAPQTRSVPPPQVHPSAPPMHPNHVNVNARTVPASMVPMRQPLPGTAPYPAMPPAIEAPSFMGLVLFAAPLALATLVIAALALS